MCFSVLNELNGIYIGWVELSLTAVDLADAIIYIIAQSGIDASNRRFKSTLQIDAAAGRVNRNLQQ